MGDIKQKAGYKTMMHFSTDLDVLRRCRSAILFRFILRQF